MKKSTLLLLSAMSLAATANVGAQTTVGKKVFDRMVKAAAKKTARPTASFKSRAAAAEATKLWKVAKEEELITDDGQTWMHSCYLNYTYDNRGNLTANVNDYDGYLMKRTNTYDSENRIVYQEDAEAEDGVNYVVSVKRTIAYDNVVKDFVVKREAYAIDTETGKLEPSANSWTVTVVRDAKGRVTSTEHKSITDDGSYATDESSAVTYDPSTGKAVRLHYEETSDEDGFETSDYKDIVWDRTDNQIVHEFSDMFEGSNRVKSATLFVTGNDGTETTLATVSIDYAADNSYVVHIKQGSSYAAEVSKKYTDANGSYEYVLTEKVDRNGDGVFTADETAVTSKEVEKIDDHGNTVALEEWEYDDMTGKLVLSDRQSTVYTYDPANNLPKEYVLYYYDMDTAADVASAKYVTLDTEQIAVTGITAPEAAESRSKTVYSVSGVRMDNYATAAGKDLYIEKNGASVKKVIRR